MRIITGQYKGRHFDVPRTFKARPTTDFAKENIFNVVRSYVDFDGAVALDLFAGTGSITLELLSRGCQQVVSIEKDRDHARFIRQCLDKLNLPSRGGDGGGFCSLITGDVFKFLKSNSLPQGEGRGGAFDFIFADPPYALENLPEIPDLVLSNNLLAEDGLFVFEHGKTNDFSQHPRFIEHRAYGSVNFSLFK